jgi:hypothetical protein
MPFLEYATNFYPLLLKTYTSKLPFPSLDVLAKIISQSSHTSMQYNTTTVKPTAATNIAMHCLEVVHVTNRFTHNKDLEHNDILQLIAAAAVSTIMLSVPY